MTFPVAKEGHRTHASGALDQSPRPNAADQSPEKPAPEKHHPLGGGWTRSTSGLVTAVHPAAGGNIASLVPRTLSTKVRQNGSACGLFPWSLAGTFPFGGPFTAGPFTAGAAAAVAAATGASAAGAGVALAPVTALPGFGTPIPWGAAGACPPSATPPPTTTCGTAAGAGLAPSEHPANPLAAPAKASAVTAHHPRLTLIGINPPDG